MTETIDKGGEWDKTYTNLPDGYYKAFVKEATAKTSQTGNPMVELILEVEDEPFEGSTVYLHLVFKPDEPDNFNNKKRRWFQESAGVKYTLTDEKETIAKILLNKHVVIKVRLKKDSQGRERNEVVGVHQYGWVPEIESNKLHLEEYL